MIKHLGLIMDGNRRWAKKRLLKPWMGHDKGTDAVERVVEFCLDHKIEYLSLYTFSIENLKRPKLEKSFIFNEILNKKSRQKIDLFRDNNVKIVFIGDRSLFPPSTVETIKWLEDETKDNTALTMNVLFCYGGRQELVAAVNSMLKVSSSTHSISLEALEQHLWTAGIPDPELIIRTGGRQRLSNYLLFQAAYSELYFTDVLWPDIDKQHLTNALNYYKEVQRNFGA